MANPNANSYLLNSHGMINGQTVQQWTQQWWTWALQSPYPNGPLDDTSGQYAGLGQPGAGMFFVAGAVSGGDWIREFEAPADTPLLVPLINGVAVPDITSPDVRWTRGTQMGRQWSPDTPLGAGWALLKQNITNLNLAINGDPAPGNFASDYVMGGYFDAGAFTPGTLADAFGFSAASGGELFPERSEGYWAVIAPQPAGSTLTLDFGGSISGSGTVKGVPYAFAFSPEMHDTIHFV